MIFPEASKIINSNNSNDDELLKDLLKDTEIKQPNVIEKDTNIDSSNFEPAKQEIEEKPEVELEKTEPKPEKPWMPYKEQAEMFVDALDGFQQLSLNFVAKRSILSKSDLAELRKIRRKRKQDKNSLTVEERELFETWILYKEFEEDIPFTEIEQKYLSKPMARIIEYSEKKMNPWTALMMAAFITMMPRVGALFALKSDVLEIDASDGNKNK